MKQALDVAKVILFPALYFNKQHFSKIKKCEHYAMPMYDDQNQVFNHPKFQQFVEWDTHDKLNPIVDYPTSPSDIYMAMSVEDVHLMSENPDGTYRIMLNFAGGQQKPMTVNRDQLAMWMVKTGKRSIYDLTPN